MANRFREFLESVVYAGLSPAPANDTRLRWLGRLRGPILRFINGPKPQDPLYLSNRTFGQKLRIGVLIATPVLLVLGVIGAASLIGSKGAPPAAELSPGEIAARSIPELSRPIQVGGNSDVEVVEAVIVRSDPRQVTGRVRNNSDRRYPHAEMDFDLTDEAGSNVGSVTASLENLGPHATVNFQVPVKSKDAAFVLVRDVRTGSERR